MFKALTATIFLTLTACSAQPDTVAAAAVSVAPSSTTLRGAVIEPSGFLTILDAPPAPYAPAMLGAPQPLSAEQIAGHAEFARAGKFQNEVMDAVQALQTILRRRESGNFVDLYFENQGEPHVVFRFLRDPERTLAKYTKDPRFRAGKADYDNAELRATLERMMTAFAADRVIQGGGTGNKENRVVLDLSVPESEFRALAARKGVAIPDSVILRVPPGLATAAVANRPLPPEIAPLVRIFPRSDRPLGIVNAIDSTAKVVLRDGCFRAADHDNALVQLPMGANLFVDSEGYLAFGSGEGPGYARVGEVVVFPGSVGEVTAPELVGPIHAACGPGKVIAVNGLASAAADRAQGNVDQNVNALRQLRKSYGLSESAAQVALQRCIAQMGMGVCHLTPPRPMRAGECPAGTKLSAGLCRTREGYTRPVPDWMKDLVGS